MVSVVGIAGFSLLAAIPGCCSLALARASLCSANVQLVLNRQHHQWCLCRICVDTVLVTSCQFRLLQLGICKGCALRGFSSLAQLHMHTDSCELLLRSGVLQDAIAMWSSVDAQSLGNRWLLGHLDCCNLRVSMFYTSLSKVA